jgi:hypothetical protein
VALALAAALPLTGGCDDDPDALALCRNLRECFPDDFLDAYPSVAACELDLDGQRADARSRYPECGAAYDDLLACTADLGCGDLNGWLDGVPMAACEAETNAVDVLCNTPPEDRDGGVPPGDGGT